MEAINPKPEQRIEAVRSFVEYSECDGDIMYGISVTLLGYKDMEHFKQELSELAPDLLTAFFPADPQ
jgi:hypothetical protein